MQVILETICFKVVQTVVVYSVEHTIFAITYRRREQPVRCRKVGRQQYLPNRQPGQIVYWLRAQEDERFGIEFKIQTTQA